MTHDTSHLFIDEDLVMREIKFRAWDNVDHMSEPFTLYGIQAGLTQISADCLVMQFTGLTDKNSVEIYEGDIVKKNDDKFAKSGVVSFIHGCWMVASEDKERYFNLHWHLSQVEIIGNIHQNRELLEQNDE